MNQLNVAKFGGTSVADYDAMQRCADIIVNNPDTRVVVVSASAGVTNYLVQLAQGNLTEQQQDKIIQAICDIEYAVIERLNKPADVLTALDNLIHEMSAIARHEQLSESLKLKDALLSFGERMSSLLFAELLRQRGVQAVNFDIRQVLKTDSTFSHAQPDIEATRIQVQTLVKPELSHSVFVTQGFIGSDSENATTTLGRGGSDYSAALLAEALDAETLHIWTDVTGIFTTDPRVASSARPIPEISFDEAAEMATFGAKILHPATLIPAIRSGSKVFVGSSRAANEGGTWISRETQERPAYRAIALRRDQVLLTLKSPNMLHATGFLADVFGILAKYKISVDLITTSEISVALTIDEPQNGTRKTLSPELLAELGEICDVKVEQGLSLVAVIGNRLQAVNGVGGKVLSAMDSYNLRMICHGASPNNLCFLVYTEDAERIVENLHRQLFE